ncbi:MAG TPA: glycoside hydrolase family 3 C-terminal domain-containing protein [Candidatus Faeciplasma gallinarum]|uniref:Glycoside hydrolase family 3 C-terminal domain-containing protein n=1 Tax=Candidatus Faeciplasma gallinarum TaxID=2840799 RepID=A0A9D1JHA1_9FIRM|nr:glycoside hydrolase family 3 C-terminal domain-containing protein [Candidatus Faeciplasma gallinarum]
MEIYKDTSKSCEERAIDLVSRMTFLERCEQLKYDAPAIERLGVPAYNWWNEGLHGVARGGVSTMFPQAIGMAASFDTQLIREIATIISIEARAKYNEYSKLGDRDIYKGLTLWSPNINIFRDPRWGRGHETYGEDPYLTSRLGCAFVEGLQGEGKTMRAAACAKHFAVHSGPEAIRHEFNATADAKDLEETYLPAFEALVKEAHVESVMGAYNRTNGEPCCGSEYLSSKLKEWGFDGYFVSDCWAIADFHMHHHVTATATESVALALKNGCDLNCGNTYLHVYKAYEEGLVTEEEITNACVHLFRTRMRLGMFDKTEYDDLGYMDVETKEHLAVSRKAAETACVLLKNDGILPLDRSKINTIGVIGPNAQNIGALRGNYYGTASRYETILMGIQDEFEGRVLFSEGAHIVNDKCEGLALPGDRIAEAKAVAAHSDVVVLCLGLDEGLEGEEGDQSNEYGSGDKRSLLLPKSQQLLLKAVLDVGKPTIVVLASGSSLNIDTDRENALIQAFYPGSEGGKAIADIIFGNVSPSGKLPVTFYKGVEDMPEFTDYCMRERTYRYDDYSKDNILYPFGFGLTYSDIRVESAEAEIDDDMIKASVTLSNSGMSGQDALEVYFRSESPDAVRNYALCAFTKVHLEKGEKKTISMHFPLKNITVVGDDGIRYLDKEAKTTLYFGTSLPDSLSCKLTGKTPTAVELHF